MKTLTGILCIATLIAAVGCSGIKGKVKNNFPVVPEDPSLPKIKTQTHYVPYNSPIVSSDYSIPKIKTQTNYAPAFGYDICLIDTGKEYILKIGKLKDAEKGIFEEGPIAYAVDYNKDGRIDGHKVGERKYLTITPELVKKSNVRGGASPTLGKIEQAILNDFSIEWRALNDPEMLNQISLDIE